jgi:hypothetical protein
MSRPFKKGGVEIEMHTEGFDRPFYPAVNVKVYSYGPDHRTVAAKYKISEDDAGTLLGTVWESACGEFWSYDWDQHAKDIFGKYVSTTSAGRSEGWLEVHGLPAPETWDAILLGKWRKFAKEVAEDIKYRSSDEYIYEMIEANEWEKEYQAITVVP